MGMTNAKDATGLQFYTTRTGTKAHLDIYCSSIRKPQMTKISAARAAKMEQCQNCCTENTIAILRRWEG